MKWSRWVRSVAMELADFAPAGTASKYSLTASLRLWAFFCFPVALPPDVIQVPMSSTFGGSFRRPTLSNRKVSSISPNLPTASFASFVSRDRLGHEPSRWSRHDEIRGQNLVGTNRVSGLCVQRLQCQGRRFFATIFSCPRA